MKRLATMRRTGLVITLSLLPLVACAASRPPAATRAPTTVEIPVPPPESEPLADEADPPVERNIDPAVRELIGVWEDPDTRDRTHFTVVVEGGEPVVVSGIGSAGDRETLKMQRSEWDGACLSWTYLVPSTGYVVTFRTVSVEEEVLHAQWSNSAGASGGTDLVLVQQR